MLLPISAFMVLAALVYGIGLLFLGTGKNREAEIFAGGRRRPLIFGFSTAALASLIPAGAATRTRITKELQQAGYYHRMALAEFAALRNLLIVGWMLLIGTLVVLLSEPGSSVGVKLAVVGVIGVAMLFGMPRLIVRAQAKGRLRRVEYSLPDALDMLSMCMTGGLPLQYALSRVGNELRSTHPDLACELRILGRQMETGSWDFALKQFANRIDTPDVQSLSAMVGQTGVQGGSVSAAFQDFADDIRRARRQRAEEHGNKTSIRLLLPIVFCLAPPIYMLLLTPAVMEMRNFVRQENRPGGILAPASVVSAARAETAQSRAAARLPARARSPVRPTTQSEPTP